ncbi:MAG: GTP-binding protein, partial [Deltaproteobacteria bacterium]
MASRQIGGTFKHQIDDLRKKAIDMLAHAEVAIDFPEEESDRFSRESGADDIHRYLIEPIETLIEAHRGRMWVDGIQTVIVGRVNAGKSSLLNRLLNEERAIVTAVPGTTRDVIESNLSIGGIPIKLMDTAGLRDVSDEVEQAGIRLTRQKMGEADLVLMVVDQSRPLDRDDMEMIRQARGKKGVVVLNKTDLPSVLAHETRDKAFSPFPVVEISALTGQGLQGLQKEVLDVITGSDAMPSYSEAVPNLRHRKALEIASRAFKAAKDGTEE